VNVSTAGGDSGDLETNYVPKAEAQEFRRLVLDTAHSLREQGINRSV
jgi:hypothetical protein